MRASSMDRRVRALLDSDAGMQVAAEAVTCRTHDPVWARR